MKKFFMFMALAFALSCSVDANVDDVQLDPSNLLPLVELINSDNGNNDCPDCECNCTEGSDCTVVVGVDNQNESEVYVDDNYCAFDFKVSIFNWHITFNRPFDINAWVYDEGNHVHFAYKDETKAAVLGYRNAGFVINGFKRCLFPKQTLNVMVVGGNQTCFTSILDEVDWDPAHIKIVYNGSIGAYAYNYTDFSEHTTVDDAIEGYDIFVYCHEHNEEHFGYRNTTGATFQEDIEAVLTSDKIISMVVFDPELAEVYEREEEYVEEVNAYLDLMGMRVYSCTNGRGFQEGFFYVE